MSEITIDNTPNVVIKNPTARLYVSGSLFGLGLVAAMAAMFLSYFPEVASDSDLPMRAIAFTNAIISFIASAFGLAVSVPNIPGSLGRR